MTKKPQVSPSLTAEELREVDRIADRLDQDEIVEMVAKQGRFKIGGETTTPDKGSAHHFSSAVRTMGN